MLKGRLKQDIRIFISLVSALCTIGLIFVYSASSVFALETFNSSFYFVKKQFIGLLIGILGIIALQQIPVKTFKQASPLLFLFSIGATLLTLMPLLALTIHGSSRWVTFAGFSFQPSELLKIALILYLAFCISRKRKKYSLLFDYLPVLSIMIIPALILLKQPDFGLTVTLFLTTIIMLFLSQFQLRHLIGTLASLITLGMILIAIKPYRMKRILVFLNPWNDPQGSGFQIIQSLIAIGSGGLWGVGISHSKQKFFYLPMQHTDFIFSIIAEEIGFIGSITVISLYLLLLYYGIKIAHQLSDQFSRLVVQGFVILINLQAVINISVASGLLPTKGLGLPFISYGNTALVCYLWMVGIIIALTKNQQHSF